VVHTFMYTFCLKSTDVIDMMIAPAVLVTARNEI
jgi:hypothetical protein